jgi:hypothetical protein
MYFFTLSSGVLFFMLLGVHVAAGWALSSVDSINALCDSSAIGPSLREQQDAAFSKSIADERCLVD